MDKRGLLQLAVGDWEKMLTSLKSLMIIKSGTEKANQKQRCLRRNLIRRKPGKAQHDRSQDKCFKMENLVDSVNFCPERFLA
jgi:hypothetical protein